ncbi:serine--tRNA ligase [Candidatus Woesearchaeota archaeon]|nr:serine--tRNA ligase [Candidatus Woesearchaeota archaeon]
MLQLNFVKEKTEIVRENFKKRNMPDTSVVEVLSLDKKWREEKTKNDKLRNRRNEVSKEISEAKKKGDAVDKLLDEAKKLPQQLQESDKLLEELQGQIIYNLKRMPNILHESVPLGKDAEENKEVNTFGEKPKFDFTPKSHVDLLTERKLIDLDRASKLSGARFYFLKGKLALLEMAIVKYAVDFMAKKDYEFTIPPHMMSHAAYDGVVDVETFEDALYKIEGQDLFLISTSEHPLTAQFMNEVIDEKELPKKLFGFSPCYRKEAGAHGKDTKGIFRVHQFNKIEQIIICKPEESWNLHEELKNNIEEFFKSLDLHFRTIVLCSGDIGKVSAKTYDVEVWMPVQNAYREAGSCSNCTNYQSARSNIRYQSGQDRKYVHTLNSTCVATTRALVAIIENCQNKKGEIIIPKVLQKYCGFKKI